LDGSKYYRVNLPTPNAGKWIKVLCHNNGLAEAGWKWICLLAQNKLKEEYKKQ